MGHTQHFSYSLMVLFKPSVTPPRVLSEFSGAVSSKVVLVLAYAESGLKNIAIANIFKVLVINVYQ